MIPIITLTMNPALDVSSSVPNVFPEHKLRCSTARNDPGGGGINVARVIKRLGGDVEAWHCSGGPTGAVLQSLLDFEAVRHQPFAIRGVTRQNVTILETATSQQYRFVMPGPTLADSEWQSVLDRAAAFDHGPRFVVASGSLPPGVPADFYARLARIVRQRGGDLVLDTSGEPLLRALEEGVFLAKPSLRELRTLAGAELVHDADQDSLALGLIAARKCAAVVVSLGPAGVLLASAAGCERLRSPNVPVKSRVGAGDSMVAGIVLALARSNKLREAVRLGIAAGSAAVMNPGTELCHAEDVERLLRSIP